MMEYSSLMFYKHNSEYKVMLELNIQKDFLLFPKGTILMETDLVTLRNSRIMNINSAFSEMIRNTYEIEQLNSRFHTELYDNLRENFCQSYKTSQLLDCKSRFNGVYDQVNF